MRQSKYDIYAETDIYTSADGSLIYQPGEFLGQVEAPNAMEAKYMGLHRYAQPVNVPVKYGWHNKNHNAKVRAVAAQEVA